MKKFLKGIAVALALVLVITPCAILFAGCGCSPEEEKVRVFTAYQALNLINPTGDEDSEITATLDTENAIELGDEFDGGILGEEYGIALLYSDGSCAISYNGGYPGAGTYTDSTITWINKDVDVGGYMSCLVNGETATASMIEDDTIDYMEFTSSIVEDKIYVIYGSTILVLKEQQIDSSNSLLGGYVCIGAAYEMGDDGEAYYTPDPEKIWELGESMDGMVITNATLIAVFIEDKIFVQIVWGGAYATYTVNSNDATLLDIYLMGDEGEYRPAKIQEDGTIWLQMGSMLFHLAKVDSVTPTEA